MIWRLPGRGGQHGPEQLALGRNAGRPHPDGTPLAPAGHADVVTGGPDDVATFVDILGPAQSVVHPAPPAAEVA